MEGTRQEMHIGPVALFTLVAGLCMSVLAVLSFSTAQAMYVLAERTAQTTTDIYEAEAVGQRFVAELDQALAQARVAGQDPVVAVEAQLGALERAAAQEADPFGMAGPGEEVQVSATVEGRVVTAVVETPAERRIDIAIELSDDYAYEITQWKATSEADTSGSGEHLWLPEG